MVLIVVLVVISLLSLAALTFAELMSAEREASELAGRGAQARALVDSGHAVASSFLAMGPELQTEGGGWYDNPDLFQGMTVVEADHPRKRGRFTILAPLLEDGYITSVRYGLEDESGRLTSTPCSRPTRAASRANMTMTRATARKADQACRAEPLPGTS